MLRQHDTFYSQKTRQLYPLGPGRDPDPALDHFWDYIPIFLSAEKLVEYWAGYFHSRHYCHRPDCCTDYRWIGFVDCGSIGSCWDGGGSNTKGQWFKYTGY